MLGGWEMKQVLQGIHVGLPLIEPLYPLEVQTSFSKFYFLLLSKALKKKGATFFTLLVAHLH